MNGHPGRTFAFLAAATFFTAGCGSSDSSEEISDFFITMNFRLDGSVEVEERIVAAVQHDLLKDGMHRALWSSQPGNSFRVEPIGGEIDGEKCLFKTWSRNGRFFMRASRSGPLSLGKHEFCYRYLVKDIVRGRPAGRQSIRWNLTGRRWPWAIDTCDLLLKFSGEIDPETIQAQVRHTKGGDGIKKVAGGGSAMSFRNNRRIQGGDSLSLSASWSGSS